MKFGLSFANAWPFNTPATAVAVAQAAEAAGFESLWTVEHVVWPESYESVYPYSRSGKMAGDSSVAIPDPLVWLSWVGAQTTRIRLGTGILILPLRNPLVLAKALATLDDFSAGRVEAGVGVGWLEEEFVALGVPFADRGGRTDDYIEAMRAVWATDDASHSGEFARFEGVSVNPKPVARSIPVTIGGHSPAAARRAGRLGDGFFPGRSDPDDLRRLFADVRGAARRQGRDPDSILLSAGMPRGGVDNPQQAVEVLADLGVHRAIMPAFMVTRPDLETGMGRAAEVIARFG